MQRIYFIACALWVLEGFTAQNIAAQGNANDSKCLPSNLFIGLSTIFEDAAHRFNTYGGDIAYTYPLSSGIGITGDAGFHVGSNMNVDYTKFQLLAGVSMLPANENKISLSPHLLAGISNVSSKFSTGNNSFSVSNTSFSIAAGTNITFPINNNVSIIGRIDYNPTFSSAGVASNFRVGAGVNINLGCNNVSTHSDDGHNVSTTQEKVKCKASKNTRELKISFVWIEKPVKKIEEVLNQIPRVEAKVNLKPQLTVKQGEECCQDDKPPVRYTELKGGVEGGLEVNVTLWGLPDIDKTYKLWAVLIKAEFKCKLTLGPSGKFNVDGVGKFYGELGNPTVDLGPICKACWYLNLKGDAYIKIGAKLGGKVAIYHWSPFAESDDGYDIDKGPDETVEASAEASAGVGVAFNGTYRSAPDCIKPPEGTHGTLTLGKAKANFKLNLKLGPISFEPNFEYNLFDGWDLTF